MSTITNKESNNKESNKVPSKIIPLNSNTHAKLKLSESNDYTRFNNQQLIPVVIQEFVQLATEFPIVFVKNNESGQFLPVAMMGVKANINLYCQNENWPANVVPKIFHQAPFSLMVNENTPNEVHIAINEQSPLLSIEHGEALFNEKGEQSELLQRRSKNLVAMAEFTQQTKMFTELLLEKKLLTQRQLTVKLKHEKQPLHIDGIYLIDETILNNLSQAEFDDLRSKGLLAIIYAHLSSIHQISRLTQKQNDFDD